MEPNFDQDSGGSPGDYRGAFIPTAPGNYTFHITGTIGSTPIDESVASGPTTFSTVIDPETIQFPAKIPSGTELATRLAREIPRLQVQAAAATTSTKDAANSARTLGIVGIVVGSLGLVTAAVALTRKRG